jgi:Zn-dependent protease with chaperone function
MRFATLRGFFALLLTGMLAFLPGCSHRQDPPVKALAPNVFQPLAETVQYSYLELFRIAPRLEYTQAQIDAMRQYLNQAQDYCVGQFKSRAGQYEAQLRSDQQTLRNVKAETDRHRLHCDIQNTRAEAVQARLLAGQAIPTAYENRKAKLDLIQNWPSQLQLIRQQLADGSYRNRRWGDVQDIGFREIAPGQQDDIKTGQDAIKQMKQNGLMPKEYENKAVNDYVTALAQKVAAHSDLRVPLHVTVLNTKEINAFALPGGYLFVNRGLLEAADDESQLAGVIGHEIAHDTARHSHKLMRRATVESIFYQAAQVAGMVLTGGVASIGAYYALQYGFEGLGLLLDLNLLGVSREYELQADQLGIQYAWNSGYDPSGFIRFFDKMATKEGYVNGLSWFYDHPPFYQRMVDAEKEILFLPTKPGLVVNTTAFEEMKKNLEHTAVKAETKKRDAGAPSLLAPEPGCAAPSRITFQPGQQIEAICAITPKQLEVKPGALKDRTGH